MEAAILTSCFSLASRWHKSAHLPLLLLSLPVEGLQTAVRFLSSAILICEMLFCFTCLAHPETTLLSCCQSIKICLTFSLWRNMDSLCCGPSESQAVNLLFSVNWWRNLNDSWFSRVVFGTKVNSPPLLCNLSRFQGFWPFVYKRLGGFLAGL